MREAEANRTQRSGRPCWLCWLAVVVCVAGLSAGRFANGFVHDDLAMLRAGLIDEPSRIGEVFGTHALVAHGTSEVLPMDTYRPISILSFFWDAWLSGRSPWSYHLTNLLLHLACVSCVFALIRVLVPQASLWVVIGANLFFGLSPQLVEAHVWINGRSDPLATMFGLSALLLWQRTVKRSGSSASSQALSELLVGLLFLAGLLSKEILLFTLPAILLWPARERTGWAARVRQALPFMLASAVYLGLRTWALGGLRSSRDVAQLREAAINLPMLWLDGVQELLWPTQLYLRGLREEYAALTTLAYSATVIGVLVIAALAFSARRRLPVLGWSLLWYALSLAPAALISAVLWPGFGRYLYMPCAGLALGVAEILAAGEAKLISTTRADKQPWLRGGVLAACCLYLVFMSVRLVQYTRDYASERTLYARAITSAPERASGYARMAGLLVTEGKVSEAIPLYLQAIEREPSEPSYALQAIFWNLRSGQFSAAERLARAAQARAPADQVNAFRGLLMRALAERQPQAAVAELCLCLTQDPDDVGCAKAARWMLDPRNARARDLREALASFAQTCPSVAAQRALAKSLRTGVTAGAP